MFDHLINKTFKHNGYTGITRDVMIVIAKNTRIPFWQTLFHLSEACE